MEFQWIIKNKDVSLLKDFVRRHQNNNFVKNRIKRNLSDEIPKFSKEEFWKWMLACLLTTQQRSGPNSKISKFLITKPFPLGYRYCKESPSLQEDSYKILTGFGGIRRTNKISDEIVSNLNLLESGGWNDILQIAAKLLEIRKEKPKSKNINLERQACSIAQNLKGIGPKQSRNLWQALGLTRYEIPIDSRIIKWLNKNGFPFELSTSGLSDENYYRLLMDGIQKWCLESGVLPCVLDAAIFSSYDGEWPENYELW